MEGQTPQWKSGQGTEGVGMTLTITCHPSGSIHMTSPDSGFTADYQSAEQATTQLQNFLEQGLQQAKSNS